MSDEIAIDMISVEIPAAEAKRIQEFINRNLIDIAEDIEEFLDADENMWAPDSGLADKIRRDEAVERLRNRLATIRKNHAN
jgi:hypothetical protein